MFDNSIFKAVVRYWAPSGHPKSRNRVRGHAASFGIPLTASPRRPYVRLNSMVIRHRAIVAVNNNRVLRRRRILGDRAAPGWAISMLLYAALRWRVYAGSPVDGLGKDVAIEPDIRRGHGLGPSGLNHRLSSVHAEWLAQGGHVVFGSDSDLLNASASSTEDAKG